MQKRYEHDTGKKYNNFKALAPLYAGPLKSVLGAPLRRASADPLEPLCVGPLHTQWEPCQGDGLDPDPKISGELSGNFLLLTLAHTTTKKAAQFRTEKGPRLTKISGKIFENFFK